MKFTENFVELCEQKETTQIELSKEIGINQFQLSRYLKGIIPDIKTVVKICDYFNCSIDYIIGFSEKISYDNLRKGYDSSKFYPEYEKLLLQNKTSHFKLSQKKVVCETSLRLWKKGTLPNFEVLCNNSSVDKLVGRL